MNASTGALPKTSSAMTSRQSLKWGGHRNVMVSCSHLPNKHLRCSLLSIATYPSNRTCPGLELRSSFFALPATAWRICRSLVPKLIESLPQVKHGEVLWLGV